MTDNTQTEQTETAAFAAEGTSTPADCVVYQFEGSFGSGSQQIMVEPAETDDEEPLNNRFNLVTEESTTKVSAVEFTSLLFETLISMPEPVVVEAAFLLRGPDGEFRSRAESNDGFEMILGTLFDNNKLAPTLPEVNASEIMDGYGLRVEMADILHGVQVDLAVINVESKAKIDTEDYTHYQITLHNNVGFMVTTTNVGDGKGGLKPRTRRSEVNLFETLGLMEEMVKEGATVSVGDNPLAFAQGNDLRTIIAHIAGTRTVYTDAKRFALAARKQINAAYTAVVGDGVKQLEALIEEATAVLERVRGTQAAMFKAPVVPEEAPAPKRAAKTEAKPAAKSDGKAPAKAEPEEAAETDTTVKPLTAIGEAVATALAKKSDRQPRKPRPSEVAAKKAREANATK